MSPRARGRPPGALHLDPLGEDRRAGALRSAATARRSPTIGGGVLLHEAQVELDHVRPDERHSASEPTSAPTSSSATPRPRARCRRFARSTAGRSMSARSVISRTRSSSRAARPRSGVLRRHRGVRRGRLPCSRTARAAGRSPRPGAASTAVARQAQSSSTDPPGRPGRREQPVRALERRAAGRGRAPRSRRSRRSTGSTIGWKTERRPLGSKAIATTARPWRSRWSCRASAPRRAPPSLRRRPPPAACSPSGRPAPPLCRPSSRPRPRAGPTATRRGSR